MSNVPVARRYARALLDAAGAEADQVLAQLESLSTFLEGQAELFATLSSPTVPRTQRMAAVEAVVSGSAGILPVVANLLRLLSDRSRIPALPFITRQFRGLVDGRMKRVRGKVTSAVKLGDAQVAALKTQLETLTKQTVVLEAAVDPSLLGGVVAQVGSHQYDGSVKSQLAQLGRTLTAR